MILNENVFPVNFIKGARDSIHAFDRQWLIETVILQKTLTNISYSITIYHITSQPLYPSASPRTLVQKKTWTHSRRLLGSFYRMRSTG